MINLAKEGFSFHTFELTKSITYGELREIKNTIYQITSQQNETVFKDKHNITQCNIWIRKGIRLFLHENVGKPPHISLVVNPRVTIEDNEYIGIFLYTKESMEQVRLCIDQILTEIHLNETFETMTLSRVDLCVNIEFDDVVLCQEYMRLFRKCHVPHPYKRDRFYSDEANYKEKNKRSFRARKYDTTFTIYDKLYQSEKKRLHTNTIPPNGLIRIEVALGRNKILKTSKERNQQGITNMKLFQMFGEESKEIMKSTVYKFFPHGGYLPYKGLRMCIEQAIITKKIKKRMLCLVEKASQCKDLNQAILNVTSELDLSEQKRKKLMEAFEEYNVNPITLPNNTAYSPLPGIREILGYEKDRVIGINEKNIFTVRGEDI